MTVRLILAAGAVLGFRADPEHCVERGINGLWPTNSLSMNGVTERGLRGQR